jgi:NAD(P)-dependent dehydrogenase (short-subunit alcohol dehydrogenase family)
VSVHHLTDRTRTPASISRPLQKRVQRGDPAVSQDLKLRGIRVNALSPGPTHTPGLLGLVPTGQEQGLLDTLTADVPLTRVADPAEIAGAALFLASPDASFVNGIELFADGGQAQV